MLLYNLIKINTYPFKTLGQNDETDEIDKTIEYTLIEKQFNI
jgi:hypothetical protein